MKIQILKGDGEMILQFISYLILSFIFVIAPWSAQAEVVIHAGRILDVHSGTYLENQAIVVSEDKILQIQNWESIEHELASDSEVIDLSDKTILPGLIDAHTHLLDSRGDQSYVEYLTSTPLAYRAIEGAEAARKTLLGGFTAVRDVETEGAMYADASVRDAVNNGLIAGPRIQAATRGIVAYGNYYPRKIAPEFVAMISGAQQISGVEEARKAVREQIHAGADLIKMYADFPYVPGHVHPTLSPEEMKMIVDEAHRALVKVAAHATTPEGIRNAIEAGADSIEHGSNASDENLQMMAERGVVLVPTTNSLFPDGAPEKVAKMKHILIKAQELGVVIANGSDAAGSTFHGTNAVEITAMANLGVSTLGAIQAATIDAATLMGLEKEIGSLEVNKLADIIAVDGNPLETIEVLESVSFVMKGGKVYKQDYVEL